MAVVEFEYGGKQQRISRCGGRGVRRAAAVVRKAGGGDRKRAPSFSRSLYGRHYGTLSPDAGLVRYAVLRIFGAYNQPEATVNHGSFRQFLSPDSALLYNGHEAQRLGTGHANAPVVSENKTTERTSCVRAYGFKPAISHRKQSAACKSMRPVAQPFVGMFCSHAFSGHTYPPAYRALNTSYLGRGACFVSCSGAGTRSGKGWGVLSSDIGFLIESVARSMMEWAGHTGNGSPAASTTAFGGVHS